MNDKEIRLIKGYFNNGYCCDLDELKNVANKMINKNNQLQSNWNSLREWLIKKNDFYKNGITDYSENVINMVLDKMNELEGVDNENN